MLNSKLPLWYQVAQSLRSQILLEARSGSLRLPTEPQLAERFGVSIITVRQALKSLEDEGLISRRRRLGTFVNADALPNQPLQLIGSIDAVFAHQTNDEVVVLEKKRVPVPGLLQEQFPGVKEAMLFRRLRKTKGIPTNYAVNHVLMEYGKRVTPGQLRQKPMTKVLRDELKVPISRIEDTIEARLPTPEIAQLLQMDIMSPVLFFTGVTIHDDGRVIDVAWVHYRGDRYKFSVGFDIGAARGETAPGAIRRTKR